MLSFSTYSLPIEQKAAYWSQMTRHNLAQVDVAPQHPFRFDGQLNRLSLGPVVFTDVYCAAVRVSHTREHIARMTSASYVLYMPLQNGFELSLDNGRGIRVKRGELCIVDQSLPYDLTHGDSVHTLCVSFPERCIEGALPHAKRLSGRVITTDRAPARILMSFLRELHCEIRQNCAQEFPYAIHQGLLNLIAGMCVSQTDLSAVHGIRARAKSFREFIDMSATNSEFKQADVAGHFGVSERYVRAALREDGTSFSRHLLIRRLVIGRELLTDPDLSTSTITEVALRAGFNSTSHFGRSFKTEFGVSPRQFRIQQFKRPTN